MVRGKKGRTSRDPLLFSFWTQKRKEEHQETHILILGRGREEKGRTCKDPHFILILGRGRRGKGRTSRDPCFIFILGRGREEKGKTSRDPNLIFF